MITISPILEFFLLVVLAYFTGRYIVGPLVFMVIDVLYAIRDRRIQK